MIRAHQALPLLFMLDICLLYRPCRLHLTQELCLQTEGLQMYCALCCTLRRVAQQGCMHSQQDGPIMAQETCSAYVV